MKEYTQQQLQQAHKAITSSINKIQKVQQTLLEKQPLPKPQLTLAKRNLEALKLAIALIEREMQQAPQHVIDERIIP